MNDGEYTGFRNDGGYLAGAADTLVTARSGAIADPTPPTAHEYSRPCGDGIIGGTERGFDSEPR